MASLRAAQPPHFFKIIVADTKEIDTLKIPTKFMEIHGSSISNSVCIKVPNGRVWRVDVVENDGKVLLQNGWKEFAEFYSLKYGSLLVFKYEGNSKFRVLIFDMSASEIDYPLGNVPGEDPKTTHVEESDDPDDISVQILDIVPAHTISHKRRRINSITETDNGANMLPSDSHFINTRSQSNKLKLERSRRKMYGSMHDFGGMRTLTSGEKDRAFQRAEAFKPKNPSFRITMHPSYIGSRVTIPSKFAKMFLTQKNGDVILSSSDGKTWPARYACRVQKTHTFATLYCGWKAFVEDNSLKVGDVCVFELIKRTKILLKAFIFRATCDSNCPLLNDNGNVADKAKPKRSMFQEPKVEPSEISNDRSDDFSLSLKQERKGQPEQLTCKYITVKQRPSYSSSTRALVPAGQRYPSFKAFLFPGYLRSGTLHVPSGFIRELPKKRAVTVMLRVADRLWPVTLHTYASNLGKFCGGYGAFLRENNLQVGDECVFELIDREDGIVNVSILRHGS